MKRHYQDELSEAALRGVRDIMDTMSTESCVWDSWSTSGMRMLTDDLVTEILNIADKMKEE